MVLIYVTDASWEYFALTYDWLHDKIYFSLLSAPYGVYSISPDGSSLAKIRSGLAYDMAVHPCQR